MANDYCTFAEIQTDLPDSSLGSTTDTGFQAAIEAMITEASREIDDHVGRWPGFFYPTTDDTIRYYDGSGEIEQRVDEMVSLTSVAVAESGGTGASDYTSWTQDTDYFVEPYNYSQLGQPIRKLVIDWNGSKHVWYGYRKAVKVTGVFGYAAATPAPVKRACKIQTLRWYMRAKQGYQDGGANPETLQMFYVKELDPDIKKLLHKYVLECMT